jgi:hypothetical protein
MIDYTSLITITVTPPVVASTVISVPARAISSSWAVVGACTVASLERLGVRVVECPDGRVRCYLPRAHRDSFYAVKGELRALCPMGIRMTLLLERA